MNFCVVIAATSFYGLTRNNKKCLDLNKMKKADHEGHNRLFKNFEDKDIIWMMNNIADASEEIKENQEYYINSQYQIIVDSLTEIKEAKK